MSIAGQAGYSGSTLSRFLDAYLPKRHVVVERWQQELTTAPWSEVPVEADRSLLGRAVEMRLGLDLAQRPGYWNRLAYLPGDQCAALFEAAGFSHDDSALAETTTTDPMLCAWKRTTRPDPGDDAEHVAAEAVIEAACWDNVAHQLRDWCVQTCRGIAALQRQQPPEQGLETCTDTTSIVDALNHIWRGYCLHGRLPMLNLGHRVILEPEIVPGFAHADLVIGRTLVDVKCYAKPALYLNSWLDQLLGYVLVDWGNSLGLNQLALYIAWHATLLTEPLDRLLRTAATGKPPELDTLQEQFHRDIRDELDEAMLRRNWARFSRRQW